VTEDEAADIVKRAMIAGRIESYGDPRLWAGSERLEHNVKPHDPQAAPSYNLILCRRCDDAHPLMFLDNETADCCVCGCRVQFRPDVPPGPKTCLICAATQLQQGKYS